MSGTDQIKECTKGIDEKQSLINWEFEFYIHFSF